MMEVVAMVISFAGVMCISFTGSASVEQDSEVGAIGDLSSTLRLIGCLLVFVRSCDIAAVTVATRKLQKVHFASILFYYSCVAVPVTALLILEIRGLTVTLSV